MKKLRVGYILDDRTQTTSFVHDIFCRSKGSQHYSIELLILQKTPRSKTSSPFGRLWQYVKGHGLGRMLDRLGFAVIERLEKVVIRRFTKLGRYYRRFPLDTMEEIEKLYVTPQVSKSGFVYRYRDDDLARIREKNLDVLLRGGSGILRGQILEVCPFGVLSFHHADNEVNRGGPPGFWEVYRREACTGFVIQRLTDELDGGDVLFKGWIPTSPLFLQNQLKLFAKANVFLHLLLEKIGRAGRLPQPYPKVPYAYRLYRMPNLRRQLIYVAKTYFHLSKKIGRKLVGRELRWGVAYQFVSNWKNAVLWRSNVIKNPSNHYLADPFVVHRDGRYVCYVEDYSYADKKGAITAYEISPDGDRFLGTALSEEFHMSYPFLFEAEGELYMCPETVQAKDIRLYRCTEFPLKWTLHKVLMDNVRSVDTAIFKANDRWWMLTNVDSSDVGEHGSELHLFYADSFDSSAWTAHPQNPVVFDSARARNGGFIADGDGLYRAFQIRGFDVYGAALGVARITELTTQTYREEPLFTIPPTFFEKIGGTHTYSFANGLLAVDFKRIENRWK